ncbi:MAG: asparagine synthase-related protein [Pseudomonadota bacterium]
MLSYIVAPHHILSERFSDRGVDLLVRRRPEDQDFYADDRVCVISCCRLDNPKKLQSVLGISKMDLSPAKIIAFAYKRWGEALVNHLFGEFVFVIWDIEERSLFCGRDRFGQMPFAYSVHRDGITFSSDFISVAMVQSSPPVVNERWIVDYIIGSVSDQECTPFEGVKRLPPGACMRWCDGHLTIRSYWSLSEVGDTLENFEISDLSRSLELSTSKRTKGHSSVAMLSGGLDSSSIAILARDEFQKSFEASFPTVSLVFESFPDESERPFIDDVLKQGGFDSHFVNAEEYDAVSEIDRLVRIQGGPLHGSGAPIHDQALARIEQLGFKSVLDGHGGDEVISSGGIMLFYELASDGKWLTLMRELISAARHTEIKPFSNLIGLHALKGRGVLARVSRIVYPWLLGKPKNVGETQRLLRSNFEIHSASMEAQRLSNSVKPSNHPNERSYIETILSAPIQTEAFETLYRHFRSRGLRPEYPFWDQRVVEYCVRVPADEKLKNGVPRSLIRSVMGDRLPPLVSKRTSKFDFTNAHIRSFQSSSEQIRHYAIDTNHRVYNYVDRGVFAAAISDLHNDKRQVRVVAHQNVWTTLNLLLWFDMIDEYQSKRKGDLEIHAS